MNEEAHDQTSVPEQDWRQRLLKSNLSLPAGRVRTTKKAAPTRTITAAPESPASHTFGRRGIPFRQGNSAPAVAG